MDAEHSGRKIFISYHSSKIELVAHLSRYLEKNGVETWYAPRDIRAGQQWDEAIIDAIKDCKALVLLFCAQADSSRQVKRELSLADKYKKPVFWLRIERVEPYNLSYFLTSTQWLDWLDTRDTTLEKLVKDLTTLDSLSEDFSAPQSASKSEVPSVNNAGTKVWAKGIIAFDTDRAAAECAARVYFNMAQKNPESSVILPTGRSATAIFRAMLRIADEYDGCPFGEATVLSDTETFGVWAEHETSRTKHINEKLIEPLRELQKAPAKSQLNLMSGIYTDRDPLQKTQKILREFPPCVHAVSVSPVGEVLAYEVGTYTDIDDIIDDGPRIVEVGEHSKKYIDPNQPSKSIMTIGLGVAMSSSVLLIPVFDMHKANILNRLFNGPMTAGVPATLLRNHPNAYVLTTKSIAHEAGLDDLAVGKNDPKEAADWITAD
ncbi:MAG: TIR domain-containing protein [Clostridia bacterium]|nr:TIR domain-containing protein [Clostridia bacterium]